MKIYAEWFLNGQFHNRFFNYWSEFFEATFSPDCKIIVVKEV